MFSVIIPNYNRGNTIERALDSVKYQTYRPIQVIIVDDGSTDDSMSILENWKINNTQSDFIVEIHRQENAGAAAARNKGIYFVQGKYIQFLDSDDLIHPDRFKLLAAEFERGADFVHTGFANFVDSFDNVISSLYGNTNMPLVSQIIQGRAWMNTLRDSMTRDLLIKTGYWNEELICFEDREFMERAVMNSNNPIVLKEILAYAERTVGDRISDKQKTKQGRKIRLHCEKNIVNFVNSKNAGTLEDKKLLKSRLYGLAFRSRASGWFELGRNCFEMAEDIHVSLNNKARQRRFIYRTGYLGSNLYILISKLIK